MPHVKNCFDLSLALNGMPIERGLEILEAWKLGNLEVWRLGGLEARKTGGLEARRPGG